jgi:hypothetical protein
LLYGQIIPMRLTVAPAQTWRNRQSFCCMTM